MTTALTAPTTPVEGDIWFDTTTNTKKVWDGAAWKEIDSWLGNQTIHHATGTLKITEALHNNADIHIEGAGDLSITNTNVSDGTNFYITNTTGTDNALTFTGFSGAYLRNGGTATDVAIGGLTIKANTRYLAHITDNGGNFYFNATEAGGTGDGDITSTDLTVTGGTEAVFSDVTLDIKPNAVTTTKIAPSTTNNQVLTTNASGVVSWENKTANVTNEMIFDADVTSASAFIYVSLDIDGDWRVIRYKKDDANAEATATKTSHVDNNGQTAQPNTLALCVGLTY